MLEDDDISIRHVGRERDNMHNATLASFNPLSHVLAEDIDRRAGVSRRVNEEVVLHSDVSGCAYASIFTRGVPRRTNQGWRFRPNQVPSRLSESQFGRQH